MNPLSPIDATPFDDGALYDLLLGEFPIGREFYVGLAKAARGPVLDVGCGTGRILIPCLQAGVDIEGLDLFDGMLTRLREKAAALRLNPTLHRADMAGFKVPRRFALIIIPFNAFVHNLTTEAQLACLRACREHLFPGGTLALDVSFPGLPWIGGTSETRTLEGEMAHPGNASFKLRAWDTRTFDRINQIQYSRNEVEIVDAAGKIITTHPSKTAMRWTYKPEMELLLRSAGFDHWKIFGDFDGRPLEKETDTMVIQAWAAHTEPETAKEPVP